MHRQTTSTAVVSQYSRHIIMDQVAGWGLFIALIISNIVLFLLIDGWFEGDINGLRDDDT